MTKISRGPSGKATIRALEKAGFYIKRRKGSHVVLRRDSPFAQVTVPEYKSIDTGTLSPILDGAGLSADEFIELFK
jgi:predicted RNA binding protein YcfA (HicA-like mRNA interferase family)